MEDRKLFDGPFGEELIAHPFERALTSALLARFFHCAIGDVNDWFHRQH
ncbi:unannotated protein [freshwater metagenome]|uniref:Unannotated protein n=1 Tax=freshwater metagenome TaxID=449393 RepID=A0A6J6DMN2_9ZZZZ